MPLRQHRSILIKSTFLSTESGGIHCSPHLTDLSLVLDVKPGFEDSPITINRNCLIRRSNTGLIRSRALLDFLSLFTQTFPHPLFTNVIVFSFFVYFVFSFFLDFILFFRLFDFVILYSLFSFVVFFHMFFFFFM